MIGNLLFELLSIFPIDWYKSIIKDHYSLTNHHIFWHYQNFVNENMNILINRKFSINQFNKQDEQINKILPHYLYEFKVMNINRLNNVCYWLYQKLPDIENELHNYMNKHITNFYIHPIRFYLINEIEYQKVFLKKIENKMSGYGLSPYLPNFLVI